MIFISVGTEPSLFLFKIPLIHGGLIKVENVGLIEKYKVTTTQKEKKKKVSASSKAPKSNSKEELSFPSERLVLNSKIYRIAVKLWWFKRSQRICLRRQRSQ
ncbi:hypothetical protein YC2023_087430 [Brassica napus]